MDLNRKSLIIACLSASIFLSFSCDVPVQKEDITIDQTDESDEPVISDDVTDKTDYDFSFRNPALNPLGANLPRMIRAYFLVGEYNKMLEFVIIPECYEKERIINLLRKSSWGYELKLTNCQWNADSSFILTIKTNINNTVGQEQYFGRIENDTAKLVLFPNRPNLFEYYTDDNEEDPCMLVDVLSRIYFEYDQAKITSASKPAQIELLNYLKSHSSVNAKFVGHTSNEGGAAYNLELSEKRAEAICDYLIKNGIKQSRLSFEGKGMKDPIFPNTSEENKKKNRRVEIFLEY